MLSWLLLRGSAPTGKKAQGNCPLNCGRLLVTLLPQVTDMSLTSFYSTCFICPGMVLMCILIPSGVSWAIWEVGNPLAQGVLRVQWPVSS